MTSVRLSRSAPAQQFGDFARREAMMIGETPACRDRDAIGFERREEFAGIGDAGECEHPRAGELGDGGGLRGKLAVEPRQAAPPRGRDRRLGSSARGTDHQHGVGMIELGFERRPQRTGREHPAIADAAAAVEHRDDEVLGERRVLPAVVHDDGVGSGPRRRRGARRAIMGDDGGGDAGEQQRFVADRVGGLPVDPHRTGKLSAIAAREKERAVARRDENMGGGDGGRRLAAAADGEIADAQDRHARPPAPAAPSAAPRRSHRRRRPGRAAARRRRRPATRNRAHASPARSWIRNCMK